MIEDSYRSWDLYTTGQLVDGQQQKKKMVFIKWKWNHVIFSRATILSFHPVRWDHHGIIYLEFFKQQSYNQCKLILSTAATCTWKTFPALVNRKNIMLVIRSHSARITQEKILDFKFICSTPSLPYIILHHIRSQESALNDKTTKKKKQQQLVLHPARSKSWVNTYIGHQTDSYLTNIKCWIKMFASLKDDIISVVDFLGQWNPSTATRSMQTTRGTMLKN